MTPLDIHTRGVLPDREDEAGLNQYRVRDYRAWYAHITLAMPADDYLAAARAHGHHPARP